VKTDSFRPKSSESRESDNSIGYFSRKKLSDGEDDANFCKKELKLEFSDPSSINVSKMQDSNVLSLADSRNESKSLMQTLLNTGVTIVESQVIPQPQ